MKRYVYLFLLAGLTYEYKGNTYYFFMAQCKEAFQKKPEQYVEVRVLGPGAGVPQRTDQGKSKAKAQEARVKDQSGQTHAHVSSIQEPAAHSRPEKPAASDSMGAHGSVHVPAK
jgi:hypothetical protein